MQIKPEVKRAKETLKRKGWSLRAAAPRFGVHFVHLCLVLNGKRESKRLLRLIDEIPPRRSVKEAA